jgi:hypothetical protein
MGHIVLSGASGHETSTHYFSCLGGTGTNRQKQTVTRYAEQVFLHPVGFACHIVHCGVSGPRNIDALFFMLGLAKYEFLKKRVGTRYVEVVFLHVVGYAGHVLHSGASEPRNVNVLFFVLGWGQH